MTAKTSTGRLVVKQHQYGKRRRGKEGYEKRGNGGENILLHGKGDGVEGVRERFVSAEER